MKLWLRRLEFSLKLGAWAGANGWKKTGGKCPDGDSMWTDGNVHLCTNQLSRIFVAENGGAVRVRGGEVREGK